MQDLLDNPYNHPITHKKDIIYGLVNKIILLSNSKFHQKNFEIAINDLFTIVIIIVYNSYPLNFIFTTIKKRIKHFIFNNRNNTNKQFSQYCTIPFLKKFFGPNC